MWLCLLQIKWEKNQLTINRKKNTFNEKTDFGKNWEDQRIKVVGLGLWVAIHQVYLENCRLCCPGEPQNKSEGKGKEG